METIKKFSLSCVVVLLTCVSAATAQTPQDSLLAAYDSLELKGVTVTAAKPLVKMEADKMTYDVQGDADAQSATVLDMLRKVPMVTVDGQDNITVNGSSSFKVYVDGKPNPMFSQNASQVFKMMPASAVEKIEVITNPGARYDAEGAVGVLNIVLARQQGGGAQSLDGFTGTLRASVSSRGEGGGIFASARQGKLSASGNVILQQQRMNGITIDITRDQFTDASTASSPTFSTASPSSSSSSPAASSSSPLASVPSVATSSQRLLQHQTARQRTPFAMASLNMAYDLDSLNTLSASLGLTAFNARVSGHMLSEYPVLTVGYDTRNRMRSTALNLSADWQHFFSAARDRSLTLSYLLSYTPQTNAYTLSNFTYDIDGLEADSLVFVPYAATVSQPAADQHQRNHPRSQEHTLQLDYTTPLAAGQTLSVGTKAILRRNTSDIVDYRHTNNIAAAYAEHEAHFGRFTSKAGLRYEHTWQKADFSTDYGTLVPSASLSYAPQMTKNIGLTYNMRISRPGITYLNPYVDRSNPEAVTFGNPDIDVAKTHNIGLTASSFSQKLMVNIGLHQSLSPNQIAEYSFYQDGILNTTYGNIARERNTSLTAFLNWLAAKNTRLMLNGGITYADLRTSDDPLPITSYLLPNTSLISHPSSLISQKNHGWQGNLMLGLQQTLPWQLKLSANVMANSRTYTLQGHQSGFQLGVLNVSKSLLADRLNITLTGISGLGHGGKLRAESTTRGLGFQQCQRVSVPIQQVQLNVSYTFGNTRIQAKQHRSRIENDFTEKKSDNDQLPGATGM